MTRRPRASRGRRLRDETGAAVARPRAKPMFRGMTAITRRASRWPWIAGGLAIAAGAAIWASTVGRRVEQPSYDLEGRDADFEIRRYPGRIVAETRVAGAWRRAGNEGFRRLISYIKGANRRGEGVAMTAPVAQRSAGERIAMTAPVGQHREAGAWTVSFTMPSARTIATLPAPTDARISLRELPARRVAVVRFRGRWSEAEFERRAAALARWAGDHGLVVASTPEVNRYDPPWTPPFLRRNEVWLEVTEKAA